jgi:hypothetical protein
MERVVGERPLRERLKRELRLLNDAPPGTRFTRRHKRMLARKQPTWVRVVRVLGSGLVAIAGVAFLALPGPGLLVVVLGLAMLGGEFAFVARWLDYLELLLRRWWDAARRAWSRAGWPSRTALILIALAVLGAIGLIAWRVLFG